MTLFIHTHNLLYTPNPATGQLKTLTSRLVNSEPDGTGVRGEMLQFPNGVPTVVRGNGIKWIIKWQVGRDYAIQSGRGMKATGRYEVLALRQYDIRNITKDEVYREGFVTHRGFWLLWLWMHYPHGYQHALTVSLNDLKNKTIQGYEEWLRAYLWLCPDDKFQAWQISFKVIERYEVPA